MPLNNLCFCGSSQKFSDCCQPFIEPCNKEIHPLEITPQAFPKTAEQLMRSRFSAYAFGNNQYIYDTYAKSSQAEQSVKEITDWSKACTWVALKIHSSSVNDRSTEKPAEQFVEFSAFYISDETLCELRENSRFILESNEHDNKPIPQWRYIDGDIIVHNELTKIKRNALCPCNNYSTAWSIKKGKKFKQCCGK